MPRLILRSLDGKGKSIVSPSGHYIGVGSSGKAGLGIWEWASNDRGAEPDVVMACYGVVVVPSSL